MGRRSGELYIKAGHIVLAINKSGEEGEYESTAWINADHINISGTSDVYTLAGDLYHDAQGRLVIQTAGGLYVKRTSGGTDAYFGVYDQNNLTAGILVNKLNNGSTSVKIRADAIDLEGYVTATELAATSARINNLTAGYTQAQILWANTLKGGTLQVGATTYGASRLTVDGTYVGAMLTSSGTPVSISHGYFTGCTKSTSGNTVTLTFTKGVGDPVEVSFDRGGQASGVSLSAAGNVRETQGEWLADTTVSLNGTTATKTLNVDAVFNQGYAMGNQTGYTTGYAAGWAAARARSGFAWSGSNENVLTINRPGETIDTSDTAVTYSIGSYKASGDRLYNSAANYFTYNGVVYTTVTPQNDPEHTGQWTPSKVNVNRSQYINVGQ